MAPPSENAPKRLERTLSVVTAVMTIVITCLTLFFTRMQNKFDNRINEFETQLDQNNLQISKATLFSNLMTQFINGTVEEKEYALILMTQVDSSLSYKLMERLIKMDNQSLQPTLKNVLVSEALQYQENQSEVKTEQQVKNTKLKSYNKPKELLVELNKRTDNPEIRRETNIALNQIDYCNIVGDARLMLKIKKYPEAVKYFRDAFDKLPSDKKNQYFDQPRIKLAVEGNDLLKACQLYNDSFTRFCP